MSMDNLQALNPHISIHHVSEHYFKRFGRMLPDFNFSAWLDYLEQHTQVPAEGNVYVAAEPGLEALPPFAEVRDTLFGGMPIQAGYCNGNGSRLNGLEYHKAIEVLVAQTDLILQLADYADLEDFTMDTRHVGAFYVPRGTGLELKPTALHLAPNRVSDFGFKAVIVLPLGVNTELPPDICVQRNDPEARLLMRKGKWMLAHAENLVAQSRGAVVGLVGANPEIRYK